ncbi:unnamed protein product, partial [Prorocentrum cordatum]
WPELRGLGPRGAAARADGDRAGADPVEGAEVDLGVLARGRPRGGGGQCGPPGRGAATARGQWQGQPALDPGVGAARRPRALRVPQGRRRRGRPRARGRPHRHGRRTGRWLPWPGGAAGAGFVFEEQREQDRGLREEDPPPRHEADGGAEGGHRDPEDAPGALRPLHGGGPAGLGDHGGGLGPAAGRGPRGAHLRAAAGAAPAGPQLRGGAQGAGGPGRAPGGSGAGQRRFVYGPLYRRPGWARAAPAQRAAPVSRFSDLAPAAPPPAPAPAPVPAKPSPAPARAPAAAPAASVAASAAAGPLLKRKR